MAETTINSGWKRTRKLFLVGFLIQVVVIAGLLIFTAEHWQRTEPGGPWVISPNGSQAAPEQMTRGFEPGATVDAWRWPWWTLLYVALAMPVSLIVSVVVAGKLAQRRGRISLLVFLQVAMVAAVVVLGMEYQNLNPRPAPASGRPRGDVAFRGGTVFHSPSWVGLYLFIALPLGMLATIQIARRQASNAKQIPAP